jgi:ABC-type amino acid transport substrate-binding protein
MIENLAVVTYGIRKSVPDQPQVLGLTDYAFDIYSLVRDDMPELASILDKALAAIPVWDKAAIMARWLPLYAPGQAAARGGDAARDQEIAGPAGGEAAKAVKVVLNRREREYLSRKGSLRNAWTRKWPPVERWTKPAGTRAWGRRAGAFVRAAIDCGCRLAPTASWTQTLEAAEKGGCDFIAAAVDTPERRRFLEFTSPYRRLPLVAVTRATIPSWTAPRPWEQPVGVARATPLRTSCAPKPGMDVTDVPGEAEGLPGWPTEGSTPSWACCRSWPTSSARTANGAQDRRGPDEHLDLCVAVPRGRTEILSHLSKGVSSLTAAELDAIFKRWVAVKFENGFDYTLVWRVAAERPWSSWSSCGGTASSPGTTGPFARPMRSWPRFWTIPARAFCPSDRTAWWSRVRAANAGTSSARTRPARPSIFCCFPQTRPPPRIFKRTSGASWPKPDFSGGPCTSRSCPGRSGSGIWSWRWNTGSWTPAGSCMDLTDVTDERRLESEVETERRRLASVWPWPGPPDFFQVLDGFAAFWTGSGPRPGSRPTPEAPRPRFAG